jgi:hypothetical protein
VTIVDASPDAGRVLLSDGSSGRTWVPGEALGEPVPLRAAVAGRADCPGGWWFLRRDRRAAVRLDPATLEVAAEAPFPEPAAAAACVDAGGARWGLLSEDGTRWVVVDGGREAGSTALGRAYRAARVDPARRLVALLSREEVSIRGLDSLREVLQIPLVEPLLAEAPLAWSPAGRRIAFGFKTLHVYDVERKAALASLPARGWIRDVGWIGEDELTAADDRGRTYWARLPAQAWAGEREAAREGSYAAFWVPAHLRWFLVERGGSWEVLDYRSAGLAFEASVSSLPLWSLAVASSRGIVAASGKDVRIALVDAATGRTTRTLEGHTDGVPFVRFVPDGTLVSASDDGSIRVWNADTGEALATVTAHRSLINAFAATADGTWLVSVSSDRKVRVWKLAERLMMRELVTTESSGSAAAFLAGTDGKLLVSDWGGRLYLFEGTPPEWAEARRIRLAQGAVYMLCPAPDGWWAVVIEGDARGLWWVPAGDVRKAERVDADEIGYCHSTPDGSRTALTYATHVDLRENATRAVVATWRRARVDSNAVAVDPAAGLVLEGDGAGRLRGWRIP